MDPLIPFTTARDIRDRKRNGTSVCRRRSGRVANDVLGVKRRCLREGEEKEELEGRWEEKERREDGREGSSGWRE